MPIILHFFRKNRLLPILLPLLALIGYTGVAQEKDYTETVEKVIQQNHSAYVALFKKLHQHPELGFQENETAQIIAEKLSSYGYTVTTEIGKTGVVGVLKNGDGPVVMYRAELDALPVLETTDLSYKSTKTVFDQEGTKTPVMHACGHDVHMTWMLSAADFMSEHRDLWKGTLVMVGQPAEESILGAEAMIADGLYEKYAIPEPDYLYGLHDTTLPTGTVVVAQGTRMAGTDQLDVTFYGVGGHGSSPHLAKDPVMMAVNAVNLYQQAVSRMTNPRNPAVLTVGAIESGSTNNVIPDKAVVKINLRWFHERDREVLLAAIDRINKAVAQMYEVSPDTYPKVTRKGWSSPQVNSKELAEILRSGFQKNMPEIEILTEEKIPPTMASEDFHHLVIHNKKKDYLFVNVGIVDPKLYKASMDKTGNPPFHNHNGNFQVDLKAIPVGRKAAIYGLLSFFDQES